MKKINLKGNNKLILILLGVVLVLFGLGKYNFENKKTSDFGFQENIFSDNEFNNSAEIPTVIVLEPCKDKPSNTDSAWEKGNLKQVKVNFSYPSEWGINLIDNPASPAGYPNYGNIQLCKKEGIENQNQDVFRLSVVFGADGVGGGCSDFNPAKEVVESKEIVILGKRFYLVFYGDKGKDIIKRAYVSENDLGYCPNVAVFHINEIKGLSGAGFYFEDTKESPKPRKSQEFLNSFQVREATKILESFKFSK